MNISSPDIDTVTALIQQCADELMLPRFGRLRAEDVTSKQTSLDPEDLVTIVDHQVEERLTRALLDLVPTSAVVGEEAAHDNPELLRLTDTDAPLWLLDPLDGTKNFARGDDGFGVMLAWVVGGVARAAWIVLPARQQTFVAEAGGGAFKNGIRVSASPAPSEVPWRGGAHLLYMPGEVANRVTLAMSGRVNVTQPGCSATEYTDALEGRKEFSIYYRLLPWDHAAPALILSEGGGCVDHVDGQPYRVRSADQLTVVARDGTVSQQLRGWLKQS